MLSPDNKNSSTVKTKGSRSGMIEYRESAALVRYYYHRSRGSIDLILMTRAKSIPMTVVVSSFGWRWCCWKSFIIISCVILIITNTKETAAPILLLYVRSIYESLRCSALD